MDYDYLDSLAGLDPDRDDDCQKLANYLAAGLNSAIAKIKPDTIAVRETRSYDAVDLDLTCFPLLKVYRIKEVTDVSGKSEVDLVCSYAMVMPDRGKMPGIMKWVAEHIKLMLSSQREEAIHCAFRVGDRYTTEYRIGVNDFQQPVYAYLRISFTATES
jgi:hypothetical protein